LDDGNRVLVLLSLCLVEQVEVVELVEEEEEVVVAVAIVVVVLLDAIVVETWQPIRMNK
jgi:hypothetical protein